MTSYKPLWKLLIDKDMTKTDLRLKAGISANTITRMGRGDEVSTTILNKIMQCLELTDYSQIITFVPDDTSIVSEVNV